MTILGIETSCDETAAALIEDGKTILSSVVASSAEIHAKTGGIIPEEAARKQISHIFPVINRCLEESSLAIDAVDAIAVTIGPGLIGSLLVGVETAKTLARVFEKPIVPVNHLLAHIYANWLGREKAPSFPALALVVSGGHTDLVLLKSHNQLEWIGGTRDDAAGEAFDKTARLLGLGYPGGPAISKLAGSYLSKHPTNNLRLFPRPMIGKNNFDFSFSGLKTAVSREIQKPDSKIDKGLFAAEVQEAICEVLVSKTLKAAALFRPKSLLLAGGVSANLRLRNFFEKEIGSRGLILDFFVPPVALCTDNAASIAACAYYKLKATPWRDISSKPELTIAG